MALLYNDTEVLDAKVNIGGTETDINYIYVNKNGENTCVWSRGVGRIEVSILIDETDEKTYTINLTPLDNVALSALNGGSYLSIYSKTGDATSVGELRYFVKSNLSVGETYTKTYTNNMAFYSGSYGGFTGYAISITVTQDNTTGDYSEWFPTLYFNIIAPTMGTEYTYTLYVYQYEHINSAVLETTSSYPTPLIASNYEIINAVSSYTPGFEYDEAYFVFLPNETGTAAYDQTTGFKKTDSYFPYHVVYKIGDKYRLATLWAATESSLTTADLDAETTYGSAYLSPLEVMNLFNEVKAYNEANGDSYYVKKIGE